MVSQRGTRRGGLVTAVAGLLFIPYALTKGRITTVIIAEELRPLGLAPDTAALLFHLLETVPIVVMMFGIGLLRRRIDVRGRLADAGVSLTLVGFGLTILTHIGEHQPLALTVPPLTGSANWFEWGYYLSWLVVYAGMFLYGGALVRSSIAPKWLPWLLLAAGPTVMVVGAIVVMLDVFTAAGTFRLTQGFFWVVVGTWLWSGTEASAVAGRGGRSNSRQPAER